MIKILMAFFFLWGAWYVCIDIVRHMDGQEKWALTKLLSYSALCAVLSVVVLTVFVLLF